MGYKANKKKKPKSRNYKVCRENVNKKNHRHSEGRTHNALGGVRLLQTNPASKRIASHILTTLSENAINIHTPIRQLLASAMASHGAPLHLLQFKLELFDTAKMSVRALKE